jgi:hypothetical protein
MHGEILRNFTMPEESNYEFNYYHKSGMQLVPNIHGYRL